MTNFEKQEIKTASKKTWETNIKVREEFDGDFEAFEAYQMAVKAGKIKGAKNVV